MLLQGRMEDARALAVRLKGMFGRDFYIEIQDHGLPEERRVNPLLIANWTFRLSQPTTATMWKRRTPGRRTF